ncbi:hypothetical protein RFI_05445 [Reticulomyxa filosa]|uniref:Histone deacetylase complex subunit SAP18 n=1 Tax=Reticulomyxa filosa TaxID=46433 RepID=X6NZD6_RETFI|nr:hypothetical protein RFI_05445 [Reticulomyxa filosa]|eukprot:ETO31675.1 hypothetical protein RFI_05445 [Reticulomyxa filosa]
MTSLTGKKKDESRGIDRTQITPSLIRIFVTTGDNRSPSAYSDTERLPEDEIHLHTWPDATLDEISRLLSTAKPEEIANSKVTLSYALVYPDSKGHMVVKKCGVVKWNSKNSHFINDDRMKTLQQCHYEVGDYLDVGIIPHTNTRGLDEDKDRDRDRNRNRDRDRQRGQGREYGKSSTWR